MTDLPGADGCTGELVSLFVLGGEALAFEVRESGHDEPVLLCSREACPHFVCQHALPGGQEQALCRLARVSPGRLCQAAYMDQAEQLHVAGTEAVSLLAAAEQFEARTARAAALVVVAPRLRRDATTTIVEQEFPSAAACEAARQVFLDRGYRNVGPAALLWPGEVRRRDHVLEWSAKDQDSAAPLWDLLRGLHFRSGPRAVVLIGFAVVELESGCPAKSVYKSLLEASA